MRSLSVLLLGSGTLGCAVARTLMAWGVRKMTFLDGGRVALSNPVRQTLFTHADAAAGRPKALAAAEAVRAVMPDAEVNHVEMEIPMPGHPHQSSDALRKSVEKLTELVSSHDVVCMLTDSRESRWLPALLVGSSQEKYLAQPKEARGKLPPLGLTVALGFDSFLVSRQTHLNSKSACYFCNDVTAPADSIANRTLDQQCTVTRPGLSGIASNVAVELLAALVQHPGGFGAKPSEGDSPLGKVPQQVRGYLSDYRLAPAETEPFDRCICCSDSILQRYLHEGWVFVDRITKDSTELEQLSGLADMKAALNEDQVISLDDDDDLWDD
jgi:ubiquitin-like modifier-activating enzyme ATG7